MSRFLAQHNEELASDYDQDLSSLLPELKGIVVTAEANDSLIQYVDVHNQFVDKINENFKNFGQVFYYHYFLNTTRKVSL